MTAPLPVQPTPAHPAEGTGEHSDIDPAALFHEWHKAALGTAARYRINRDGYGEQLSTRRAGVYADAADLVDQLGAQDAVAEMLDRAGQLRVLSPPMAAAEFDAAGLDYIAARAWQFCAQHIDPNAATVQPAWP